ncbi:MAG: hypothetical protein LBU37_12740 [Tannerellaceae bacterium]|jgi:hypothetical protein|nr:hypothetical protein [Tannerellaceae bacterium]
MKKGLCLYIVILFFLPVNSIAQDVWDGSIDENWPDDLTQYELTISTPAQLARLAQLVNDSAFSFEGKKILLVKDINLNHILWEPIGKIEYSPDAPYSGKRTPFRGHFDGKNKKIRNLRIEATYPAAGLFGYIENGAKIENLTLANGRVNGDGSIVKDRYSRYLQATGALVGYAGCKAKNDNRKTDSVIIHNCHNVNVTVTSERSNSYSSGLVGCVENDVGHSVKDAYESFFLLEDCSNTGAVSGSCDVAGIVAYIHMTDTAKQNRGNHKKSVLIKNCLNKGFLSGTSADVRIGGITGCADLEPPREYDSDNARRYNSLLIESCANYGDIENSIRACIGGIAGSMRCGELSGGNKAHTFVKLSGCYSACTIYASDGIAGGLIGDIRSYRTSSSFSPVKIIVDDNYVTGRFDIEGDATAGGLVGDVFLDERDYGEELWEESHFERAGFPVDCRIRNNLVALAGIRAPYANTFRIAGHVTATGLEKPLFFENYAYIEGSARITETAHYKPNGEDWRGTMLSMPLSDWNSENKTVWDFDPANRFMPKLANVSFEQPDIPNPMYGKESAGIAPVSERPFSCSTSGNGLYIEATMPGDLSVYKFSGSLYTKRFIPVGPTTIQMPKDFYIVKFNGFSEKVVVNR